MEVKDLAIMKWTQLKFRCVYILWHVRLLLLLKDKKKKKRTEKNQKHFIGIRRTCSNASRAAQNDKFHRCHNITLARQIFWTFQVSRMPFIHLAFLVFCNFLLAITFLLLLLFSLFSLSLSFVLPQMAAQYISFVTNIEMSYLKIFKCKYFKSQRT